MTPRTSPERTRSGRPAASRLLSTASLSTPALLGTAALLAVTACSSAQPAGTFTPGGGHTSASGGQATATASTGGYVMPPFGKNVHIEMTSWLPANPDQAQAVNVDKDYELAYLYAEYKGGQDQSWENYVNSVMEAPLQQALQAKAVTTESFTGTVMYFDMSVIPDPLIKGDLDVSSCFDNAGAENTSLTTGAVIADTASPDSRYIRITDELRKDSGGQWQVYSSLPSVYYPQAAQCKP